MNVFSQIFQDNKFKSEDLPDFERKLFFEGERRRPFLVKFVVLLFLSTIIASFGVIADSTATVIGAMIIAPLMTPIMAAAAAIVMGNSRRSAQSLLLVALGVVMVIVVSWLIGLTHIGFISATDNGQISARISPSLTDLAVALASGAAGAFAFSRDDIADSLPGVAIAISLVPPLCVVGIMLSEGQIDAATGAMLLFLTNFLSILLAGGLVLALLNLAGAATVNLQGHARRNAFIVIAVSVVLVSIPLATTSYATTRQTLTQYATQSVTQEWLEDSNHRISNIRTGSQGIFIQITGDGTVPSVSELEALLRERLGEPSPTILEVFTSDLQQLDFQE